MTPVCVCTRDFFFFFFLEKTEWRAVRTAGLEDGANNMVMRYVASRDASIKPAYGDNTKR